MSDRLVPRPTAPDITTEPATRPASLEAPHTPAELAWWKVERRKYRRRALLGSAFTFGIPVAAINAAKGGVLAQVHHPTPEVLGDLFMFLAVWLGSAVFVGGMFTWWATESSTRETAIRARRVDQAMLE